MSDISIEIKNVSKFYGRKQALQDLNVTIPKGMFGLLGRNGAGKTTLMKSIATLLRTQKGEIIVCGESVKETAKIRSMIGYLPQDFNMYGNMTVTEALDYLGVLSGMDKTQREQTIAPLLEQVNMTQHSHKKVKALSGGMKQRLGIAQALLHDPKVLIVDEPTAGLDPEERVRFRNLLCQVAENKTVILSTHIVGDIEATCEEIAILDEGKLLFRGTVSQLCDSAEGYVYTAEVSQKDLPKIRASYTITATLAQSGKSIVRFLSPNSHPSIGEPVKPNAEDAYIYCLSKDGKGGNLNGII